MKFKNCDIVCNSYDDLLSIYESNENLYLVIQNENGFLHYLGLDSYNKEMNIYNAKKVYSPAIHDKYIHTPVTIGSILSTSDGTLCVIMREVPDAYWKYIGVDIYGNIIPFNFRLQTPNNLNSGKKVGTLKEIN